jgi:UDP-glucose 4-epimerase
MIIGITGVSGFIGAQAVRALQAEGHRIVLLDYYTLSWRSEPPEIQDYPDRLDWVLHFGAIASIQASLEDPFFVYANNLQSTLLALKIAHQTHAAFLFMSSYVYGSPQYLPIDEQHPLHAANPYMGSKILGEDLCRQISGILSVPLIILRGFHIYGAARIPRRLISDLLDAARKGKPLTINDSAPRRDYLYIKDFCRLLLYIVSFSPVKTGTYNVGYGQSYSNLEVAELVREIAGIKEPVIVKAISRPGDILDCVANLELVKTTFSWSPLYSLRQGLTEAFSSL